MLPALQWEPPQISHCRGMLDALRRHAARHVAEDGPPQSAAAHQASVKEQVRLMNSRPAGVEYTFATALTGRKIVRVR